MADSARNDAIGADVRCRDPAHELTHIAVLLRVENEVPMVRHDAIGEYAHADEIHPLKEQRLEVLVISISVENPCATVCTVDDMIDGTAD